MGKSNQELHRLHDGEAGENASLRAGLDDGDQLRLAAIAEVGAAVRNTLLAESRGIDVWAAVEKQLPQDGKQQAVRSWRSRRRAILGVGIPAFAATAAALILWVGAGRPRITNACDVELLDVSGASATVLKLPDHDGKGTTTVIWTTEE